MVTGSKKPKAAPKAKAAAGKTTAKVKTAASKPISKPKTTVKAKAAAGKTTAKAKTAASKPISKPKTTVKAKAAAGNTAVKTKVAASKPKASAKVKTTNVNAKTDTKTKAGGKAPGVRKVGEMVYNDELFEALSEAVLLGEAANAADGILRDIKKHLYDYDIYLVSFLTDGEIDIIAGSLSKASGGKIAENALKSRLLDIRDNARVFIDIATKHNSVRGFIDRTLKAEGHAAGKDKLKASFNEGHFGLKGIGPETCESFLLIF